MYKRSLGHVLNSCSHTLLVLLAYFFQSASSLEVTSKSPVLCSVMHQRIREAYVMFGIVVNTLIQYLS